MNVPFYSSGALSHAHYALVKKVESAGTSQAVDEILKAEVATIRDRLSRRSLSSVGPNSFLSSVTPLTHTIQEQCKECLVILLYCCDTTESPDGIRHLLDFALVHAVNLAVTGRSLEDRRIGACDRDMFWESFNCLLYI